MKKFALFSTLAHELTVHTPIAARLNDSIEASTKLLTKELFTVLNSCLLEAETNLKGTKISVGLARDYLEDAVNIADNLLENDKSNSILDPDGKKILSRVYGNYADFLRQTTSSTHYANVRRYVDKSLMLDPSNQLAKETDSDISYNYKI